MSQSTPSAEIQDEYPSQQRSASQSSENDSKIKIEQSEGRQTEPIKLKKKITPKRKRLQSPTSLAREDLEACKLRYRQLNRRPYYEVSAILAQRVGIMGDRKYKVRWAGYSPNEDTWVRPEDLNCPDKLAEFIETRQLELRKD